MKFIYFCFGAIAVLFAFVTFDLLPKSSDAIIKELQTKNKGYRSNISNLKWAIENHEEREYDHLNIIGQLDSLLRRDIILEDVLAENDSIIVKNIIYRK